MAITLIDSFDHYSDLTTRGWTTIMNGAPIANAGPPFAGASIYRWSGGSMSTNGAQSYGAWKAITSTQTIWACFAVLYTGNQNNPMTFVAFRDSGTIQIDLRCSAANKQLYVTRNGTQIGSTGSNILLVNNWYHIDITAYIEDTTNGWVTVKLNGNTELNITGEDTKSTSNFSVNQIQLGANATAQGNNTLYFDDLVCGDTTGTRYTTSIGDVRTFTSYATGAGSTTQLSVTGAASNYLAVDETAPNGDTDYVYGNTVNDLDTYNITDLPSPCTVYAVQPVIYAKKMDGGTRNIKSVIKLNGDATNYTPGTDKALTASYAYYTDILEQNPSTSSDWLYTEINSMEAGVKLTA